MWDDKIVEKVRRHRDEHASKFDYDVNQIYKDLKNKEKKNKHKKIALKPRIYLESTGTFSD